MTCNACRGTGEIEYMSSGDCDECSDCNGTGEIDFEYPSDEMAIDTEFFCCFPGKCLMYGRHMSDECHTVEMYEASVRDMCSD